MAPRPVVAGPGSRHDGVPALGPLSGEVSQHRFGPRFGPDRVRRDRTHLVTAPTLVAPTWPARSFQTKNNGKQLI